MRGKLTKSRVDEALPQSRDFVIWDEEVRGFGLKVTPAGRKIYVIQYRMGGRGWPTKRLTIGAHGIWTPGAARERATALLRDAKVGVDPQLASQSRKTKVEEINVSSHAAAFLAHKISSNEWRSGTHSNNAALIRRWIEPAIGELGVSAIGRREIAQLFDTLPPEGVALRRSLFALMRPLFSWAVERGVIERNPFDSIERPSAGSARSRVLSDSELSALLAGADALAAPFRSLIKLLVITGQRRDEVGSLQWSELNRTARTWMLPAERSKNRHAHFVPLSDLAIVELDALAGGSSWPKTSYVFTTNGRTPVSGFSKIKTRLERQITSTLVGKVSSWRIHDIRRTVATNLQKLGVRLEVTESILNHVSGSRSGLVGVYQLYQWEDEKREALQKWSAYLDAMKPVCAPEA